MKQTVVDFLIENLHLHNDVYFVTKDKRKIIQQAKEMEKEQIEDAFEESRLTHPMIGFKHETFEDYYKKTFNTNEK
jgi:hypothetical protein